MGLGPVIYQDYLQFTSKSGVYEARTIHHSDTMAVGDAAAGNHQAGISLRDGDCDSGGNHLALAGLQYGVGAGIEVRASIARMSMAGRWQVDVELQNRDVHADRIVTGPDVEEKSGVTVQRPHHKPDDYRSSLLELLGFSSPYERAITRSDVAITRPAPPSETDRHFPHINELQTRPGTEDGEGLEGLVQRLWNATETAEQDLVIEDWGPESPLDRTVGRYRWAWWPVLLGVLVIGLVLVISSLRGIPASQADDLRQDWAAAALNLQSSMPAAREAAAVITDPASTTTALAGARNDLIGFTTSGSSLRSIITRPFPTPPPLASGQAFDELKPTQADLEVAAISVNEIADVLTDAITYRTLLDQAFVLPSLPIAADQATFADLGVQVAAAVSSSRAAVRQLPIGPAFAAHRSDALAVVNRLETWQASYLDALRLGDIDAATELKTEITDRIAAVRSTVNAPLASASSAVEERLAQLDQLLGGAIGDLTG